MAYDEALADRITDLLIERPHITPKKMFGGIAWMLDGNMAFGILDDFLMVRLSHEGANEALTEPHTHEVAGNMRKMRGFLYVGQEGIVEDEDLEEWLGRAITKAATLPPK